MTVRCSSSRLFSVGVESPNENVFYSILIQKQNIKRVHDDDEYILKWKEILYEISMELYQ